MLRKVPLIVILGSTGTGKTKLSLELAERFCGEIISADSMQVYANLDIATAKASKEEQSRIKHHLLDVATPGNPYTVVHFRNAALPIIENLLAQSKCPIVVGGTNYYIESLLWDVLVSSSNDAVDFDNPVVGANINFNFSDAQMSELSSAELHNHLKQIDVDSANRIHPNNKRKIVRAIQVYQQTGETLTSKWQQQRQQPGGNRLGGPLRYPHTILLWLRCNQDILNGRLDKRVDDMLKQGLLQEIRAFYNKHCSSNASNDASNISYTKGVLQTIGFKEFIPYLEQFKAEHDQQIEEYLRLNNYQMPNEAQFKANNAASSINDPNYTAQQLPPGLAILNSCLNELKLVTRRYSKKQIKWINNRFLARQDRPVPDLYELDTSNVTAWHDLVFKPAEMIVDCYRNAQVCEIEPMHKRIHPGDGLNEEISFYCNDCQRHFVGEFHWQTHLKSNKHKKVKESLKRKQLAQSKQTELEKKLLPESSLEKEKSNDE